MVALFSVDLLPEAASLVDGLQHSILVSKQRRGAQAGQDVCCSVVSENDTHKHTHASGYTHSKHMKQYIAFAWWLISGGTEPRVQVVPLWGDNMNSNN